MALAGSAVAPAALGVLAVLRCGLVGHAHVDHQALTALRLLSERPLIYAGLRFWLTDWVRDRTILV